MLDELGSDAVVVVGIKILDELGSDAVVVVVGIKKLASLSFGREHTVFCLSLLQATRLNVYRIP